MASSGVVVPQEVQAQSGNNWKKLFVGGLNPQSNGKKLQKYFQLFYGFVEYAYVPARDLPPPVENRGFGFVVMRDAEAARKIVEKRYHVIDGRITEVSYAHRRAGDNENNSPIPRPARDHAVVSGPGYQVRPQIAMSSSNPNFVYHGLALGLRAEPGAPRFRLPPAPVPPRQSARGLMGVNPWLPHPDLQRYPIGPLLQQQHWAGPAIQSTAPNNASPFQHFQHPWSRPPPINHLPWTTFPVEFGLENALHPGQYPWNVQVPRQGNIMGDSRFHGHYGISNSAPLQGRSNPHNEHVLLQQQHLDIPSGNMLEPMMRAASRVLSNPPPLGPSPSFQGGDPILLQSFIAEQEGLADVRCQLLGHGRPEMRPSAGPTTTTTGGEAAVQFAFPSTLTNFFH